MGKSIRITRAHREKLRPGVNRASSVGYWVSLLLAPVASRILQELFLKAFQFIWINPPG
jgi:hypothetical protein